MRGVIESARVFHIRNIIISVNVIFDTHRQAITEINSTGGHIVLNFEIIESRVNT